MSVYYTIDILKMLNYKFSGTKCYAKNGDKCSLPFKYKGVWYKSCSSAGARHDGWWCATSRKSDGTYHKWDNCKRKSGCT